MRNGLAGWAVSGAVLGAAAMVMLGQRADAATIYPFPGGSLQWHLSVPISIPPGAVIPGPGGLGTIGNGGAFAEHALYHVLSPFNPATGARYDLTLTDVTYDFHDVDLDLDGGPLGGRARVQVTILEAPPDGITNINPTTLGVIPATNLTAANSNMYPDLTGVGFPAVLGQYTTVLDSSTFFMFRDAFFDGALSGSAGTAITSDGLAPTGHPTLTPLSMGSMWLDQNSQGVATDCHNFQTGLFVPYEHVLFANVRVYNPGNPGLSPVKPISSPNFPGWVWLHLQGRYR